MYSRFHLPCSRKERVRATYVTPPAPVALLAAAPAASVCGAAFRVRRARAELLQRTVFAVDDRENAHMRFA